MARKKLQFVWPKDGYKGKSGHRGFWGRLGNIVTDRGPDVFLQKKGDSSAIKPDRWGNWDSYHYRPFDIVENSPPPFFSSRGTKRYDPQTRRYVQWSIPNDWNNSRLDCSNSVPYYPHFTQKEYGKMIRQIQRNGQVDTFTMGPDWHQDGPKRFQYEHDWFWNNAHRVGDNLRHGMSPFAAGSPFLSMMQHYPQELDNWILSG